MADQYNKIILKDESISFSSEDTKDDSGDYKMKSFECLRPSKRAEDHFIFKGSKLKLSCNSTQLHSSSKLGINIKLKDSKKIENFNLNSHSEEIRMDSGKFSLLEVKKSADKNFREVKPQTPELSYPFVQDLKGPIYFSKGKSGATFLARIKRVISKINRSVFDKGLKYLYRIPKDVPEIKFWNQRFYYYSKFDEGIKMDYESWYSVTPEDLAYYISKLAGKYSTCIDPFAGSGGNVIQFSKNCDKVYAVDIDPVKIEIMKNNCEVYKCPNNIEIFQMDFLKLDKQIRADYVFLSPPWGGLEYKNFRNYSLKKMVTPDIHEIIKKSLSIGKNIMFYLPRLIDLNELFELIHDVTDQDFIYLDVHVLESANKIKAILLLYGPNIASITKSDIQNFISLLASPESLKVSKDSSEYETDFKETTIITRKLSNSSETDGPEYHISTTEASVDNKSIYLENGIGSCHHSKEASSPKNGKVIGLSNSKENIQISLWKIYSIIGLKNFIEAIIKFKERYEPADLKPSNKSYIPNSSRLGDLLIYLKKEILTDKQLARIHL